MMFVIGATQANYISDIRKRVPNHFFLVPGVGAQGGSLKAVSAAGLNKDIGLLINSSRGIIYAGNDQHFGLKAQEAAKEIQLEMESVLMESGLI